MPTDPQHTIKTIGGFKAEYQRLLTILETNIHQDCYPRNVLGEPLNFEKCKPVTFDYPTGDATPYIELNNNQFHFVVSERGTEIERRKGNSDEVLELFFSYLTGSLGANYAAKHSKRQNFRRVMFAKQIELLELLNPEWASAEVRRHQTILQKNP